MTIAARTATLKRTEGLIPFYWDPKKGALLLELSPALLGKRLLYFTALGSGIGSTDLMADRSSFGNRSSVARFQRVGPRVLFVVENDVFRATGGPSVLERSVELSFPTSVLAALPVEAEQDGTVLCDATPLLIRDAFDLIGQIQHPERAPGGPSPRRANAANGDRVDWRLDDTRSAVDLEHTRTFPLNTELEALLTFTSSSTRSELNQPESRALTVRQHQSLVALPEPGFKPRERDPRVGFVSLRFEDFSQPFDRPLERAFIERWRLQKKDPRAAVSEPQKPIVFYLDRAIPEPLRTAVRRGILWWNEAFAQAGFKDALRVEDLPEGADPLDMRYSTVQWTHRAGRGWSVGETHVDPRTGEILHAVVQLDSHRMRTVDNYWQILQPSAGARGQGPQVAADAFAGLETLDPQHPAEDLTARRLALLTSHEVGHVLGLDHNFAASTYGRGSVMDYYAPRIRLRPDGSPDLGDAYMQGVGSYDKFAIEWGYSEGLPGAGGAEEQARLDGIVERAVGRGIFWSHYQDPRWNPYDDGPDPVTWLAEVLPVRAALLQHYGAATLRRREPWSMLATRFPLVYLFHQYALGAAVNVVGGARIALALQGDGQRPVEVWPAASQRQALGLLLGALAPAALDVSPELWRSLAPPENVSPSPERFDSSAGYLFSPGDGARAVVEIVVGGLLDRERLERLVTIQHMDAAALGATEVVTALVRATFAQGPAGKGKDQGKGKGPGAAEARGGAMELAGVVQSEVAERLMRLAMDAAAPSEVKAVAWAGVEEVQRALQGRKGAGLTALQAQIDREVALFLREPRLHVPGARGSGAPPGPPI
ncbi:MAG TPA: zinc-dependent metalloprotease [Polyangia bacterium]|nr:zinc-dependent metalloprotease [Polyangia bacterium]